MSQFQQDPQRGGSMRKSLLTAGALAFGSFALAGSAGAQYMNLDADARDWGLSPHETRVVQFALRDEGCYRGRIDGVVGPQTRAALRCAQDKLSGADVTALARGLDLYSASFVVTADGRDGTVGDTMGTTTREAAGDVAPTSGSGMNAQQNTNAQQNANAQQNTNAQQDMNAQQNRMRDSSAARDTTDVRERGSTTGPIGTMKPSPTTTPTNPTTPTTPPSSPPSSPPPGTR
jgi:hypothetical protein